MRISHLATSPHGSKLAAAEFEHTVHIWDINSRKRLAVFDTVLDFGGNRLAITGDGRYCVAGAYHVAGVAAYSTATGKVVWQRKDLKKVQQIRVSNDDKLVYCCFDRTTCHVLDRRTGKTIRTLPGVRGLWLSPAKPIALLEKNLAVVVQSFRDHKTVPLDGKPFHPLLAAAFADDCCVVSESGGPLRCFDVKHGKERWRYLQPGEHFLDVAFVEREKIVVGISWAYHHGGPFRLLQIDPASGAMTHSTVLPKCTQTAFFNYGSNLLLNTGAVVESITGKRRPGLAFLKR
jgi:hypothetical protein